MKRQLILCVIFLLSGSRYSHAQLASETKTADVCLVDALLRMDEMSTSHCGRFEGQKSQLRSDSSLILMDIYGYSVGCLVPTKGEFHSYGFMQVLGPVEDTTINWSDALRVAPNKKLFRTGSERRGGYLPTQDWEGEGASKDDPTRQWPFPELDPFGLVFSLDKGLHRRGSQLSAKVAMLDELKLLASEVLDSGNIRGTWLAPTGKTKITMEFDRKQQYLPILFKSQLWDATEEKLGRVIGTTQTDWLIADISNPNSYAAPKSLHMSTQRSDGAKMELKLHFQWVLDPAKRKFDFDKLIEDPPVNLRRYFDQFFDEAPPK